MKSLILFLVLLPGLLPAQEYARILDQSTTYVLDEKGKAEIREVYSIRINSEKGKYFAMYYDYFDKFRKISDVNIEILDKDGTRVKRLRRGDGEEVGFNPSYEISDAKILVIDPEYQNYPYIMKVSTVVKLDGYISLPTWMPRERFNLTVDKAKLTVDRPVSLDLRLKEENIKGTTVEKDNRVITTFEVSNLPAIDAKIRYSDFYEEGAKVLVSPEKFHLDDSEGSLSSWSAFGDWFLKLNNEPYELTAATKTFIDGLPKNDKHQLIRDIYTYMQDKTRYISIQIGIGGFKSLPTTLVEKYGYGDCKALTTYMKNMLHYAGVSSNYILVRAGRDVPDVKSEFPSNQFNHVFLGIPLSTDTVMLECTSQTLPSGYTGTFTDDRNVLWMENNKSAIIRSKIYDHVQNRKTSTVKVEMTPDGNAKMNFVMENEGVFFDDVMIYNSAPSDYVQEYNFKQFSYSDFAIKDFSYKQANRNEAKFKTNFSLHVNGLAKQTGQHLIMGGMPAQPLSTFIKYDDLAKFSSIKRGMTVVDNLDITLPPGYWIYNLPPKETIKSPFGEYTLSIEFDGQVLKIERSFFLYKGDYTRESYAEFKAFREKVNTLESRKLVLKSKT